MAWRSRVPRLFLSVVLLFLFAPVILQAATKKPPVRPVNINTATAAELQQVPGIGPVTAKNIVEMRKSYGAFRSVDDLLAIRGIGRKRLEKMRKYLTVGKASAPASKAPPAAPQKP
ncbi:MAG: helix-hairpin-helix domain-containing protein [Acidobacteriia bacterium]|nr:helix-hairpin-helix domain-containing protein [Terriglobia bacterium]